MVIPVGMFASSLIGQSEFPNPPTDVTVVAEGIGGLRVRWTAPASGLTPTNYRIHLNDISDTRANTVFGYPIDTGSTDTSYLLTGLKLNTQYAVRVASVTGTGSGRRTSAYSPGRDVLRATTLSPDITARFGTPVLDNSNRTITIPVTAVAGITNFDSSDVMISGNVDISGVTISVQGSSSSADWTLILSNLPSSGGRITFWISGSVTRDGSTETIGSDPDGESFLGLNRPNGFEVVPLGRGGLRATWLAPSRGPTPDSYEIRWKLATASSYGNWGAATGRRHDITGLLDNTAYDVQVRSVLGSQQSDPTTAVRATTASTLPTPTFTATAIDHRTIEIRTSLTHQTDLFQFRYATSVSGLNDARVLGSDENPYELIVPSALTTYYIQIREWERDPEAFSAWTNPVSVRTPGLSTSVEPPTNFSFTSEIVRLDLILTYTWDPPASGIRPTSYSVRRKLSTESDSEYSNWSNLGVRSGRIVSSVTFTGRRNTAYDIQIRSHYDFESTNLVSSPLSATIDEVPLPPIMLEVEPLGRGGLRATWLATGPTPDSYEIRWKLATASSYGEWTAATGTQHDITGLQDNAAYDVQVRSVLGSQQSDPTTAVRAGTLPTLTATFGETVVDNVARTATTEVTFAASIGVGSFNTSDITRSGTAGVDFTIRRQRANDAMTFYLDWTLPAHVGGNQTFDITGPVSIRTYDTAIQIFRSVSYIVIAEPGSFSFSGAINPPIGLTAAFLENGDLRAMWSAPASGPTPDSYQIRWRLVTDTDYPEWTTATGMQHDITGIEGNVSFLIQVRSIDDSRQSEPLTLQISAATLTFDRFYGGTRGGRILITFPSDIYSRSVGSADFVITGVEGIQLSNFTSGSISILDDTIHFDFSLPEQSSGTFKIRMHGFVAIGRGSDPIPYASNELSISFNTFAPVNATISPPDLPIRTTMAASVVRFDAVVSDFTLADLVKSSDPDGNVTLNSITAYTGADARTGQDYFVNYSIAVDKTGLFELGFATDAVLTVNSQSVSVNVGSVQPITYDTRGALTASFGTGVVDAIARTVTVRCTFARSIDVASFTVGDLQVGLPQGVSLVSASITQVNSGSTDTAFDIVFTLPEDVTGSISYDIQGRVTENSVSRLVLISEASTEFTTFPSTISPSIKNHEGTKTGDFSVEVNFLNAVVSGFGTDDISIGLSGVTATVVPLGSGVYRIDFTGLPADSNGTFTLDLIGSVQVAMSGSRSITFAPVTITYDTRQPVSGRWEGVEGVKTSTLNIDFYLATTETVTNFEASDFTLTYVSGDTLDTAGIFIAAFFQLGVQGSETQFTFIFAPFASGVSGVFQIAVTGRATVGGVDKAVSAPTVQIAYNTTATATTPGRALFVISPAERPIGVLADEPINDTVSFDIVCDQETRISNVNEFTIADIRIHESTATGPRTPLPSALTNVGTIGTHTHYRLAYTPPANLKGSVYIEVIEDVLPDIENLPAYSTAVQYDTRPPQIPPEPIWTIPDGIVSDSTAPFDVDLNFGENVVGLTIGDFIIEGIENHDTLLYKVIDGVESFHSDNTPASIFRLKIRPRARQNGTMSIILLRNGVTAVDDMTAGPESNSQSPPIQYDTVPMPPPEPEPVLADWVAFPAAIDMLNQDYDFDLQFSRAVTGLNLSDIDVFGVQGNRRITLYKVVNGVESFHIDPNDAASLYRIKFRLVGQLEGIVWLSVSSGSVVAQDTGIGPPVSVTSPGVPYDTTIPEPEPEPEPEPLEAAWTAFPVSISDAGVDQTFELTFSRNVTGFNSSDIDEFGVANRLITVFKVINGVESPHIDDTPASVFRVKVRINANQNGIIWLSLKGQSVTASDDDATGPAVSVTSPGVPYDTRTPEPSETPTPDILSVVMPKGIQTGPFNAVVTFDRAVIGVDINAFRIVGPTGTTIESVTRVGNTNAYTVRIVPPDDTPLSLITLRLVGGIVDSA